MKRMKRHIKSYVRSRHGRATFGGKVCAHNKSGRMAAPWGGKPKTKDELLRIIEREEAQAAKHQEEVENARQQMEKALARFRKLSDKRNWEPAAKGALRYLDKFPEASRAGYHRGGGWRIEKDGKLYQVYHKSKPSGEPEDEPSLEEVTD